MPVPSSLPLWPLPSIAGSELHYNIQLTDVCRESFLAFQTDKSERKVPARGISKDMTCLARGGITTKLHQVQNTNQKTQTQSQFRSSTVGVSWANSSCKQKERRRVCRMTEFTIMTGQNVTCNASCLRQRGQRDEKGFEEVTTVCCSSPHPTTSQTQLDSPPGTVQTVETEMWVESSCL